MTDADTEATTETVESEATDESVEQEESQQPEVQEAETAEAEKPSGEEETPDPEREKKKSAFQERISELTRQRREAEREAQELRQRLEEIQSQEPEADPRPKLEEFEYDEDRYAEALDDWYTRQNQRAAQQARAQEFQQEAQRKAQKAQETMIQTFQERSNEFAEEHEDYYQTIQNPAFVQGQAMTQAILTSENGPALAYHLGKNTQVANEINNMPPAQALMELGKLEAKLSQHVAPKSSKAPDPIKPVGDKAPVEKDPETMSTTEYRRWRQKQKGLIK